MGIFSLSKNPSIPFPFPRGIALICSILLISKQPSFPLSRSTRRVTKTAHLEWVWIQHPAPRSKAARKRGVQAEGLKASGLRIYLRAEGGYLGVGYERTNIFSGRISSFWTPDGAMKMWPFCRMEAYQKVILHQPLAHLVDKYKSLGERRNSVGLTPPPVPVTHPKL